MLVGYTQQAKLGNLHGGTANRLSETRVSKTKSSVRRRVLGRARNGLSVEANTLGGYQ